jgi:small GTP-binding protein
MKLTTTVEKLDKALKGGINEGSNVLIVSDVMIDKAKFGMNIFSGVLSKKMDSGLYFVNNKFPNYVKKTMKNWNKVRNKLFMVDGFSYTAGKRSMEEFQIKVKTTEMNSYTEVLKNVVLDAINKKGKKRTVFIFDSLDYWLGSWKTFEKYFNEFKKSIGKKTVSYYLLADLGLGTKELKNLEKMFDYVIFLKAMEKKGLIFKHIDVKKPKIETRIPFEMTVSGISIYVPKILVVGPYHAGKSTLIKKLSDKPINVDRLGTTVSLDHGWVEKNGFAVDVFGTPGQERFDWILNVLSKSVIGVMLVVDSSNPDYKRAKEIIKSIEHKNIPVVILANKQDVKGCTKPREIQKELGYPTIGTVASRGTGCDKALEMVFNEILERESWYKVVLRK